MNISELKPAAGSRKIRTRVGRGTGSGLGKTAGRGHKGQKSRSGGGVRPGFEGGQMPLYRRLPKRGFNNIFRKNIVKVDIEALNRFEDGAVITEEQLINAGLVSGKFDGVKILSNGEVNKKLDVKVACSKAAAEKIMAAGGKVEVN